MNQLKVSQSKIKVWRRCKYEYYCKYVLNLEKKHKPLPLVTGTVIHSFLEAIASKQSWNPIITEYTEKYNKLFLEEKELYPNPGDLEIIIGGYERHWADQPLVFIPINGKYAEHQLEVLLCTTGEGEIIFTMKADGYVKDEQKRKWLKENKTFKRIPSEEVRFTDIQSTLYIWGFEEHGYQVDGVLWDYIRTKTPTIPKLLKSGELTKRADIDSTYDAYYNEILKHNLDPNDYIDILEDLKSREDRFYNRVWMPYPRSTIKAMVVELKETALEILYLGEISKARSITFLCKNCSYYSLCQADLRGLDKEFIIKREYNIRKEDTDEKEDNED